MKIVIPTYEYMRVLDLHCLISNYMYVYSAVHNVL